EPFPTVNPEAVPRLDRGHRRNLRVPAVVAQLLLILELLRRIELENDLWHGSSNRRCRRVEANGSFQGRGSLRWRGWDVILGARCDVVCGRAPVINWGS